MYMADLKSRSRSAIYNPNKALYKGSFNSFPSQVVAVTPSVTGWRSRLYKVNLCDTVCSSRAKFGQLWRWKNATFGQPWRWKNYTKLKRLRECELYKQKQRLCWGLKSAPVDNEYNINPDQSKEGGRSGHDVTQVIARLRKGPYSESSTLIWTIPLYLTKRLDKKTCRERERVK